MNPGDHPEVPGIYLMTCTVTGDTYVGQARSLRARCHSHCCSLRAGDAHSARWSRRIHRGIGPEAFTFKVLECCERDALDDREKHWIDTLTPTLNTQSPRGYTQDGAKMRVMVSDGLHRRLRVASVLLNMPLREIVREALDAHLPRA